METLSVTLLLIVVFMLLAMLGATAWYCVNDARNRGKSPLLVALVAVLFFPWGLLAWLVFRPELPPEPRFRLEDYRLQ